MKKPLRSHPMGLTEGPAVIVPDGVLFGASNAHQQIRKSLVEDQKLQAIISMPSGVFKPYAGVSTAFLIFTKTNSGPQCSTSILTRQRARSIPPYSAPTGQNTTAQGIALIFIHKSAPGH